MNRIKLTFGTYNSQPVGSTNDQLETAYKNSYRPFLKILYAFPKVKAAIHYSGVLLEWFEDKHPEIILLINEMVKRRQIELVGGPFYNPILTIIPNKDRISQIEYLTTYIRKHFGPGCVTRSGRAVSFVIPLSEHGNKEEWDWPCRDQDFMSDQKNITAEAALSRKAGSGYNYKLLDDWEAEDSRDSDTIREELKDQLRALGYIK